MSDERRDANRPWREKMAALAASNVANYTHPPPPRAKLDPAGPRPRTNRPGREVDPDPACVQGGSWDDDDAPAEEMQGFTPCHRR